VKNPLLRRPGPGSGLSQFETWPARTRVWPGPSLARSIPDVDDDEVDEEDEEDEEDESSSSSS